MKKSIAKAAVLTMSLLFAGCAAGSADASSKLPQAEEVISSYEENGFQVSDVQDKDGYSTFNVVSDNGGANVIVNQYEDALEAEQGYNQIQAELTQDDYFTEKTAVSEKGKMTILYNPINDDSAVLVLAGDSHTVVDSREVSQANLEEILKVMNLLGLE